MQTKLILVCALLVLLTSAAITFAGADVLVDGDPNIQNEISLTLVPGQPNDLVMAYNDNPYPPVGQLGSAYSQDGGANWNRTQLPLPTEPSGQFTMTDAFDPTITADANGLVFAAFIAEGATTMGFMPDSGLYVCTDSNLGKTWSAPIQISYDPPSGPPNDPNYRFNDRCQIIADTVSGSSYLGRVYLSWIKDAGYNVPPQPGSDIYFATMVPGAVPGGYTITSQKISDMASGTGMGNMPVPAVASDGTVYVSWLDYNCLSGGQGTIYLDKSTDGGATWGTDQSVAAVNLPPLSVRPAVGPPDTLAKGAPVLAASPNNPNDLYIVYAADPNTADPKNEADIFFIKTTDGGQNWSPPLRVNDDQTINDQILPWMEVKPDGTIDVAWYDRRKDVNDALWDVYIAKSTDGGGSFSINICLTDQSFPVPSNNWIGEYLGLAVDANNAYVAFTSSFSDTACGDVYFDRIQNAQITAPGDFEPDDDVDLGDFTTLAAAWRSTPSDINNWNLACDISDPNDNVIDYNDLDVFVNYWLYGR